MSGVIFDIKRFAIHDGPGIRTTVFLKGCPLACRWCQNPEGTSREIRLWHFPGRCLRCRACVNACPADALSIDADDDVPIRIDHDRCTRCGQCVSACPAEALAFDGRNVCVEEVMEQVLADRVFYDASGGGMTLSGGDPLGQPEFSRQLLRACRDEAIHTAIETCLAGPAETLDRLLDATDLAICDIKLLDPQAHATWTGRDNAEILSNFQRVLAADCDVLVRVPLIGGITARPENISALAGYLAQHAPHAPVELINFNPLARQKYVRLQRPYDFADIDKPLPEADVEALYDILSQAGLTCIGRVHSESHG